MMKPRFLILTVAFLFTLAACNKVTDSIQRDLILRPMPSLLNIPITNTITPIQIDSLPFLVNIADSIKNQTNNEFTLQDVTSIRLSSFTIALTTDTVDLKNNLGNIESIKILLASGAKKDSLAKVSNFVDGALRTMTLTTLIRPDTLRGYLNRPDLRYNIQIRARVPTSAVIPTKITPVYILSMKK